MGVDDDEDEQFLQRAERYEAAYNFRFEVRKGSVCCSVSVHVWSCAPTLCTGRRLQEAVSGFAGL